MSLLPSTLILAAGHGSSDSGAVSPDGKHTERDQTIKIVDMAAALLCRAGINVIIAPHDHDTHQTIPWLDKYHWGSAWAVEVHRDSADTIKEPAASFRCGIYHGSSLLSRRVAQYFVETAKQIGAHSSSWARDQKESRHTRLGWIAQPKCLSHLVEMGFMEGDNSPDHLYRLAEILAHSLCATMRAL